MKALTAQTTARDLKVSSSDGEKLYGGLYTAVITAVNEQEATMGGASNADSSQTKSSNTKKAGQSTDSEDVIDSGKL